MTGALGALPIAAIVVTHDSASFIRHCIDALLAASAVPAQVIVVDSGSRDAAYLEALRDMDPRVTVARNDENVGFCVANNQAAAIADPDLDLLLVNPDAFVLEDTLAILCATMAEHPDIGAVGPKLLSADPSTFEATGLIDSTGICQKAWGQFYDRGQGEVDRGQYNRDLDDVPALCGAALLIRREALRTATHNEHLFDDRFFMYKEDIDLCFRLQRAGWRTSYTSRTHTLHCRGWASRRSDVPGWARRQSIRNEWRLWTSGWTPGRNRWTAWPYLALKSLAVLLGN